MKLLEGFDVAAMGHNSVDYLHTLMECERLAIVDRAQYNVDPNVSMDSLLADEYVAERRKLVNQEHANRIVGARYNRTMEPAWSNRANQQAERRRGEGKHNPLQCGRCRGQRRFLHPEPRRVRLRRRGARTGILLNDFLYWFDLDADSPNVVGRAKRMKCAFHRA